MTPSSNSFKVDFSHLDKALKTLREAISLSSHTQLEKDGVVQRFEYSFELLWKTAKKILEMQGLSVDTPKGVFKELGKIGWLDHVEIWFEFLKARNKTSHQYGEKLADSVFLAAKDFLPLAEELTAILKSKAVE